jgi:hypothetical protein
MAQLSAANLTLRVTPAAGLTVVGLLITADYGLYRVDETKHHTHIAQTSRPLR